MEDSSRWNQRDQHWQDLVTLQRLALELVLES